MPDALMEKSPPMIFPTECFSSGFKLVRMSIEDSFEKGHRRVYLGQEVVASGEGVSLFHFTSSFSKSEIYVRWRKICVGWRKIEQEGPR